MKVAMWISKEKMLPVQEKLLKDAGYNIIIYNKWRNWKRTWRISMKKRSKEMARKND